MHRFAIWVCCIALAGCEMRSVAPGSAPITITKYVGFVELQNGTVNAKVKVLDGLPPITVTYTVDEAEKISYASRTEHNCSSRTSTLKYLAIYDSKMALVEESEVEIELTVDSGSIGEAELKLACDKFQGMT